MVHTASILLIIITIIKSYRSSVKMGIWSLKNYNKYQYKNIGEKSFSYLLMNVEVVGGFR